MSSHSSQLIAIANPGANELPGGEALAVDKPWNWAGALTRYVTRDILGTVVTSFVLFGMMALQGVFLARMLGPEGRGQYATAVFYTQTLMYVGLLGTHFAVVRWAARRSGDAAKLLQVSKRLGLLTGIATMMAVAFLAYFALPPAKQALAPLCVLCSLFLPLEHMRLLGLAVEQGLGEFRRYNSARLVAGATFPVMLGFALASGASSALVAAILFVAGPLVGLVYLRTSSPHSTEPTLISRGPTVKRVLKRGKPYALAVLVSDLCDRLDIFLFLWLASFTTQGFYAAAVPAANLLLVVPIALATFAFNAGTRRDRRPSPLRIANSSAAIVAVQLFAAIAFALVLEPLMVLVFGEAFRGAVPLTLALLPAYAIAGCGRVAEAFLQGRNKAILGVYSRLIGAAVMCVFIYFAFDRWAEISIPLGALAGYLVSTTILLVAILRDAKSIPTDQPIVAETATS